MKPFSVCIVGFGNVAKKHILNYPEVTKTIAVVEPDKSKILNIDNGRYITFESIKDAFQSVQPGFWDMYPSC